MIGLGSYLIVGLISAVVTAAFLPFVIRRQVGRPEDP